MDISKNVEAQVPRSPIYLDYCATTPCAPEVIEAMTTSLHETYGNAGSAHSWGWQAREQVERARGQLAALLNVRPKTLTFTSGATESNQIAIFGVAALYPDAHIITQVTEHKAVLDPIAQLEARGHAVTRLPVDEAGRVRIDDLEAALTSQTRLVSIMHINNETGAIQPIEEIAQLLTSRAHAECVFHVDGAQSVGKCEVNLRALNVDLFSLSAHKFYGPKGVGALYVRGRTSTRPQRSLPPLFYGGGQERGLRPGTTPTHQVIGMGVAAHLAQEGLQQGEEDRLRALRDRLWTGIKTRWPEAVRIGADVHTLAGVLSVTCPPELLERAIDRLSILGFSQGAACQSLDGAPSHVLSAMGLTPSQAHHTLRFCVGRMSQRADIDRSLKLLEDLTP
jgi:cysteine desulfurase